MANEDERLVVALEARIRDFEKNFEKAQKTANTRFTAIEKRAETSASTVRATFANMSKGVALALGAIGVGGLGLTAAVEQLKKVVSEVSTLAAESKQAGVAVGTFQELRYAALQANVGFDALTDGLKELQLRADEFAATGKGSAAEAFQRIGYSATELRTKLADPAALFQEVIERIRELDKAAQIRVSDELFGGTGGEQFVRLLDLGRNGVERLRKEAREVGVVLDEGMVKQAEEINRRFQTLATTVDTTLKRAVLGLIDALRGFGSAVTDSLKVITDAPAAALAKTQQEAAGIRAQIAEARKTHNMAVVGDLERRLADAERRAGALAESVRESSRAAAMSGGGGTLPADGAPLPPSRPQGLAGAGVDVASLEAAAKAAQDLAKAYESLIGNARQRVADLETEQATVGMTTQAAAAYRFEQEAINEATRNGLTLTPQQREELHQLAARYGEVTGAIEKTTASQAKMKELQSELGSLATSSIMGLADGTKSWNDVLQDTLKLLAELILKAALLGTGSFGDGGGGLIGALFSGAGFAKGGYVRAARGGYIRGPGTSTSDSIPARLSDKEFVVNAAATKRYRGLLEGINAGRMPGFAKGGAVGGGAAAALGGTINASFTPVFNIDAKGSSMTAADMQAVMLPMLADWWKIQRRDVISVVREARAARVKGV